VFQTFIQQDFLPLAALKIGHLKGKTQSRAAWYKDKKLFRL
jgi:hypothetical protein